MWHSLKRKVGEQATIDWSSGEWIDSRTLPGVSFRIARVSFQRRLELLKRLRGLFAELECRTAGESDVDRVEASRVDMEVQRAYLDWGLLELNGLTIDGAPATKESLLAWGPEDLCEEIAKAVKDRSFLTEAERKN
jgi:hypothetical protein